MKQIEKCLERVFQKKPPLKRKYSAAIDQTWRLLFLRHYHHLILVFDLHEWKPIYTWWEKPADKRGYVAALRYLEENKEKLNPH
jgi:hypothetical protein